MLDDAVPMLIQVGADLFRTGKNYITPDHDHQIARWQSVLGFTKTLAKQAFQPVSVDGTGHLLARNGKPQARTVAFLSPYQDCQAGVSTTEVIPKYLLEFDSSR